MYSPTTTIGNRLSAKILELKKDLGHTNKTRNTTKTYSELPQTTNENEIVKRLEADLQRRQEMFVKQKREFQNEISALQEQIKHYREMNVSSFNDSDQMKEIRLLHGKVLGNINSVKNRTVDILQEQERDLLRAFRARLFDIQSDLEKERNKRDEGAALWIEKNRQLEKELDWIKEMADRLERVNQGLVKENQRLVGKCKTHEEDRELLVKRLVAAKKESSRFEQELQTAKEELDIEKSKKQALVRQLDHPTIKVNNQQTIPNDVEEKQSNLIKRLKKLLDIERRNVQLLRDQYNSELQEKTELEIFLKRCIEDVKEEISRRKEEVNESPIRGPSDANGQKILPGIPLATLEQKDRARVMELLLSQERVISLLYDKTFPKQGGTSKSVELPDIGVKPSVDSYAED